MRKIDYLSQNEHVHWYCIECDIYVGEILLGVKDMLQKQEEMEAKQRDINVRLTAINKELLDLKELKDGIEEAKRRLDKTHLSTIQRGGNKKGAV